MKLDYDQKGFAKNSEIWEIGGGWLELQVLIIFFVKFEFTLVANIGLREKTVCCVKYYLFLKILKF